MAIGPLPSKISGSVKPRARSLSIWVWNKLLRRQIVMIQVTARKPNTPNVQFSDGADWDLLELPIQQVNLHVCDRSADRRRRPWFRLGSNTRSRRYSR